MVLALHILLSLTGSVFTCNPFEFLHLIRCSLFALSRNTVCSSSSLNVRFVVWLLFDCFSSSMWSGLLYQRAADRQISSAPINKFDDVTKFHSSRGAVQIRPHISARHIIKGANRLHGVAAEVLASISELTPTTWRRGGFQVNKIKTIKTANRPPKNVAEHLDTGVRRRQQRH